MATDCHPTVLPAPMAVGCIGTDHSRASLRLRDRLTVDGDRLNVLLDRLRADPLIGEAAALSTCNRIEIYVATPDVHAALNRALYHLLELTTVPAPEVDALLESRVDAAAARHLFAVAAGLRSLVVGESQILCQVRQAFEHAANHGAAGQELQTLARAAVVCGKAVRTETGLSRTDTSVSALAVEMAQARLGSLRGRTALLIGAGRMNEASAQLLRDGGIGSTVVVSRTVEAASRLAAACGGRPAPMEALPSVLADADLAISATRAPEPTVVPSTILPREPGRPLLLYDIAVPRDVDPLVGALPHVELADMDGLHAAPARTAGNSADIAAAWAIVDACMERYLVDVRMRRATPLIAGLRARLDRIRDLELAATLTDLKHLSPEDHQAVRRLAHRLTNRLFHDLVTRLKRAALSDDAETYLATLATLFDEAVPVIELDMWRTPLPLPPGAQATCSGISLQRPTGKWQQAVALSKMTDLESLDGFRRLEAAV